MTASPARRRTLETLVDSPAISRRLYGKETRETLDLPELPLQILAALALLGPSGATALAARLALSQGTVSTGLRALADRALVSSRSNPDDARARDYALTHAGQRVAERLIDLALDAVRED